MPVGLSQGKFGVQTNLAGAKRVSRPHGALTFVDPSTGTLIEPRAGEVFDYGDVIAQIRAAASLRGSDGGEGR